jgi:LemA protein
MKIVGIICIILGLIFLLSAVIPDKPDEPQRGIGVRAIIVLMGVVLTGGGCAFLAIPIYNNLVRSRTIVQQSWADIDVNLKRRYDLIDNLVAIVRGYAAHEKQTLTDIAALRSKASTSSDVANRAANENRLTSALGRLLVIAEAYPDLKASMNFADLSSQLRTTEDRIAAAREAYNAAVTVINILVRRFPDILVAGVCRFQQMPFFRAADSEQVAPHPTF